MIIQSYLKEYQIHFEQNPDFIKAYLNKPNVYFVIDKQVYDLYQSTLFTGIPSDQMMLLEATEANKTIEVALDICERMTKIPAKRNAVLVSVGGGIIQDLTGFVASTLYRGIHWTYIPTTLLSACDSCIGGKTSLNFKRYKNLLGTFYPPEHIHIMPALFETLSERDYLSGLGEVLKFNIMYGPDGLEKISRELPDLLRRDKETILKYVESSLAFKKPYIEEDEFDQGIRIHLNFAHTFGHAFETASNYAIPHGTAVAMGMIVANRISLARKYLTQDVVSKAESLLKQVIKVDRETLNLDLDKIFDAIKNDKKQINANLTAVLLFGDLKIAIYNDLTKDEIIEAIHYLFRSLN